uniref:Uncharacterized protein n=2 Tax=Aegilops tauschii subsp. strangulata TaxID=200361 RepID=A0A453LUV6_AEGTS
MDDIRCDARLVLLGCWLHAWKILAGGDRYSPLPGNQWLLGQPVKMQFQSGNCAKTLAKVDGSGSKDLSFDPSAFGFPQDANQEYFNRALQYGYPVSTQGFQDKGSLPSVPDFVLNNASAALREYQQFDHFFRPLQPLAPDGNQVQNSGINTAHRSRPSNASSCLDHVEEITSHDTDGYDDRAISFGSSCSTGIVCYPYSSPMQSDDCIGDTQDGTWAALMQMQQALEAANEECSDLTFNNTELSGGNTMQHQVVWDNGCLASPSFTSNFLPFPGEAETMVTNTSAMHNLHNSVDLLYDNDQDISSFELKVAEQKEATTSHVYEHRDEMHSAELGRNPGHDESFDLPITQDIQFSSFVHGPDGSVDSGMNLYDCEEQMEIDSLLNSFGASSDTFAQTYEMLQKGENIVDLEKRAKLAESISATFITNTVPYITQAGATESTVSDGSSWTQQYQSTSQSCGLSYSSASQWETMPGVDGQRSHLYRDEALATQGVWAAHPGTMVHSSTDTGHSDVQLPMAQTTTVPLPAPSLSKGPNSLFIGTELKKVDLHDTSMQMPLTQTTVQLPAPCLSKDPNSSFIGAEVQKVDQNHSDMQLPLTQTSHVQLPAMNLSEYPTSSFVGGTKLKKVDKHDPLPATSLSEDPKSSFIGGAELKAVDKHDSDMQLPRIQASHVPLPAVSLSEEPNSSFIGGTELKEVGKHDSDMPLPMTQASHVPLPAVHLSEDTKSSFIAGPELKEVDKHDSDMPLPMTQASHVPLPTMSLPEDTKSSFIGGTELKEVDKHDSDMQHPMTPASHLLLPSVSMSKDPKSSFTGGTELKEVGKHDSDMQLPRTQTVHVHLPTPSLSKESESSFVGGTELKEVDKHDSDMQPPMTQASHVPLPAVSLSEDPNSSFIGGTELKEVGKHDSDIQLPMTQTVCVQLPAMSLSEDPKSSFIKGTELKEVDKHDSDIPLPVAQVSHVPLPTMSLPEDTKSSFIGGTELKEVDKHDSDMQPPITPAIHVLLPAVSLSEDPKSSFTGGTELKEVGKHDSDMQLPMTQTVRVQLPAPSLSKDPDSAFVGRTELKKVGHIGYPQQSILLSASKPSHPIGLPVIKFDDEVGSRSKKRKRSTEDVLASHAQAMFEGGRLQCRRTPELAWADATLTEKVDGEKATMENSTFVSRAQRRLTLTTSLIQCLLPALSARLLAAKVADCGEAIVYHICKLMLSDMSDPVQSFVSDTNNFMQSENMPPNETSTSGKEDCKLLSEVLETFDARLGGLQSSLSRSEMMPSFQDHASALRQIEQWSMTHQLIKLSEYKRLHAGYGSGPKRPLCVGAIRKHAGGSSAPVSELKRIRCRLLK